MASIVNDGLRCLLSARELTDSSQIVAARNWLKQLTWSTGTAPCDLAYYAARSISITASLIGGLVSAATTLRIALKSEIQSNGSWRNSAREMREDDPIVATALALEALCFPSLESGEHCTPSEPHS